MTLVRIQDKELRLEEKRRYLKNIRQIKAILDGKVDKIYMSLKKEMDRLSKLENYEKAINIRNKIQVIEYITKPKFSPSDYLKNPNLEEEIRDKELTELKNILNTKLSIKSLRRIECFDVAHLQGSSASASMVTFINGVPDKSYYRHFRIYQDKKQDDYASMSEVAKRRSKHFMDWGKPDLILVDGGKGQISVFVKQLSRYKIPIVGIAKKNETLIIPVRSMNANGFYEYKIPKGNALNLIQRLRNEAHRFAQSYHHKLFKTSLFEN